jgi:hypothetical protein
MAAEPNGGLTTPLLQLSQSHLQVFETCQRKFQYLYVDQLGAPTSSEEQARFLPGSRFHLLLQQRELGLPIAPLAAEHTPLDTWLDHFVNAESTIISGDDQTDADPPIQRESEHPRSRFVDGFLLVAIYDLLVLYRDRAQILDWKTYPRPQDPKRLTQGWQTRLYLYLLAETSSYRPEQLSMTYWFFQPPEPGQDTTPKGDPEPLNFIRVDYSETLHRRTANDLHKQLKTLRSRLTAYGEGQLFPQVPEGSRLCEICPFVVHCQRSPNAQASELLQLMALDFEQIPEVTLASIEAMPSSSEVR